MNDVTQKNKKVIYTAMTGGYDNIIQPSVVADEFDYILFSNDISAQKVGIWQVRGIPYKNKDNTRIARWVKTHPHLLLPEYDISLWHDANVKVDDPEYFLRINNLIVNNTLIASMDHNLRHCLYEEAYTIVYSNLDDIERVLRGILHIKHKGYPRNNGLCETNCFLRQHNDPRIKQFCEDWWSMIDTFSRRDQLSCNYVAWKRGLNIEYILPSGYNARNHPYIHCESHQYKHDINRDIWNIPLKDEFNIHARKYYDRFIESENFSIKETYNLIILILIRKYYSIVTVKYRISTWIKSLLKK